MDPSLSRDMMYRQAAALTVVMVSFVSLGSKENALNLKHPSLTL
jgi:hypothetical protein